MAQSGRIRGDLVPPPRATGDPRVDNIALIEWVWEFYNGAVILNGFGQPSGSFTVVGTADGGTLEFGDDQVQVDDQYQIAITAVAYTGTPDDLAFSIKQVQKAAEGFTVTLVAPPGSGASVTFDWQLQRG